MRVTLMCTQLLVAELVCTVLLGCACSELKNAINGRMLTELGELEQNLVYGDMGSAELIKFLQGKQRLC